ncbi:hypothetical protein [Mycolicibacterium sp.]|uniref:hypothetical protein n=1 Tax=Mycolicibacterium sp. TaxID=2320850 RepID=UPI0037C76459
MLRRSPQVRLEKNYRCGRQIIAMADTFKERDTVVVADRPGGNVEVHHCPAGFAEQCRDAAAWISRASVSPVQ